MACSASGRSQKEEISMFLGDSLTEELLFRNVTSVKTRHANRHNAVMAAIFGAFENRYASTPLSLLSRS